MAQHYVYLHNCWHIFSPLASLGHLPFLVDRAWQEERKAVSPYGSPGEGLALSFCHPQRLPFGELFPVLIDRKMVENPLLTSDCMDLPLG